MAATPVAAMATPLHLLYLLLCFDPGWVDSRKRLSRRDARHTYDQA
jgi:hypothetical protein